MNIIVIIKLHLVQEMGLVGRGMVYIDQLGLDGWCTIETINMIKNILQITFEYNTQITVIVISTYVLTTKGNEVVKVTTTYFTSNYIENRKNKISY